MPIQLITGDNAHAVEQHIAEVKSQLTSEWSALNTHEYDTDQLSNAIADAASPGFGCDRLLIIRGKITDKPNGSSYLSKHYLIIQSWSSLMALPQPGFPSARKNHSGSLLNGALGK
jgi:hypothetical protein